MKIAIYTISKNESHNVEAFMDAADGCPVYVLDTGSKDDTVGLLRKNGATVAEKIIAPWRFDVARNEALTLVPNDVDVCVSIDMDERLEPGWQEKLKAEWTGNIGSVFHIDEWADDACTVPSVQSPRIRIHARQGFEWHRAVHEVIRPLPTVDAVRCDTSIVVKHYQKGGQRNYAPSLKMILEEDPNDADARLHLGIEYHQKGEFEKALENYQSYFKIIQDDERDFMRYRRAYTWISVAQCLHKMGRNEEMMRAFLSAIAAEPQCREAWTHFSHVALQTGNAPLSYGAAMTAHNIKKAPQYAPTEVACWGELPKQIADHAFGLIMKRN